MKQTIGVSTDMDINLQSFCADEYEVREYLQKPFNLDGFTYASNGHYAVRTKLNDAYSELPEDKRESLSKSLTEYFNDLEDKTYQALPKLPELTFSDCADCMGSGFMEKQECFECNGDGELILSSGHNDYEVECYSCSGHGEIKRRNTEVKCECCNGEKKIIDIHKNSIELSGCKISNVYLQKFKDLKNIMYSYKGKYQFAIKFDGGFGVIMGITN